MLRGFFRRHETPAMISEPIDTSEPGDKIKKEKILIIPGKKRFAICIPGLGEIVVFEKNIDPLKTRVKKIE